MDKKTSHILRRLFIVLFLFIAGGLLINWFLAYRLESYLKKELNKKVASATHGFYQLSFENLKVGIFSGELAIYGITFRPDTLAFSRYEQLDSLPEIYWDLKLDALQFKGINLIWRTNYTKLNFKILELDHPDLLITHTGNFPEKEEKEGDPIAKVLYQLISPYIDVLSIDKIEIDNASVKYVITDEETPVFYALNDIELDGYNFLLDENTYAEGKLLFCDNLEFKTNQPQTLLSNSEFLLHTDSIRVSTKDSIIYIKNIHVIPQSQLWTEINKFPSEYLNASVPEIEINGIYFVRKDLMNFLYARNIAINQSDIQYTKLKTDTLIKKEHPGDTVPHLQPWTLYGLVSPIFQSITIETIGINNAHLEYTSASETSKDSYLLQNFSFHAYQFHLDSLSDMQQNILYSEHFELEAYGITANMTEKNHYLSVKELTMNTLTGNLSLKEAELLPISENVPTDFLQGKIDSVLISGMVYNNGVTAEEITIEHPVVSYTRVPSGKKPASIIHNTDTLDAPDSHKPLDLITPYFGYLAVKKININRGNITYQDKLNRRHNTYRVSQLDFHADNVLINPHTIRDTHSYFECDDLTFSFKKTTNRVGDYHIDIEEGYFSGMKGDLVLKNTAVIPRSE
ncbi:MAG: hypothetical protein LUG18_07835 [Candidatus Azobacteroides sp.]|nr:hypothetical protein [Candidatus Azobacteroides sp.]